MKKKSFVILWFILFPLMVSLACTCGFLPFGRDKGEETADEPEVFIVEEEDAAEPEIEVPDVEEPEQEEEIEEPEVEEEPEDAVIQAVGDLATIKENFGVEDEEAYVGFVMKNLNTSLALTDIEYTINIMDGDGIIVGQENNTFPWLLPEQKLGIFFRVSLDEENPPPESYNIVLEYDETVEPEHSQDIFSSEKIKIWEGGYWPVVTGIVKNSSSNIYTDVRTSVLCFDQGGNIIGGGYEYIDFIPGSGQNAFSTYLDVYGTIDSIKVFPILTYMSDPYEDTAEFWGKTSILEQNYFLSDSNELWGGTVIQNELNDETLKDVIFSVTFYDDEGYVISHGYQYIDYFLPGASLGISPWIDDVDDNVSLSYYDAYLFPGELAEDFELSENVFSVNSSELTGDYQNNVIVRFTNNYTKQVSEVDVYVLLYDTSGSIIGGGDDYYDEPIPAGSSAECEVYVYYDDAYTVDSIKAWVAPSFWTDFE
jgi:hypothetical protein